jgi:hypothetical protein
VREVMSLRETVLSRLRELKPELERRFGIREIAIFGSVARGEDNSCSDVDIVILKMDKKDFVLRLEAIKFLEREIGRKVDMGYFDTLKTYIRKGIEKELIRV